MIYAFRLAALAAVLVPATAGAQGNDVGRAAWLAGCWELRTPGRMVLEMWMPPAGDLMLGASRTVIAGGAVREFEHLRLRARGDFPYRRVSCTDRSAAPAAPPPEASIDRPDRR